MAMAGTFPEPAGHWPNGSGRSRRWQNPALVGVGHGPLRAPAVMYDAGVSSGLRMILPAVLLLAVGALSCRATTDAAPPPSRPAAPTPGSAGTDADAPAPTVAAAPIIQPGAPGQPSRPITPEEATDLSGIEHTAADVRFMQGMIGHHAQALEMAEAATDQAGSEAVRLLAQRIDISQRDEIRMMQEWLAARVEDVPGLDHHHRPGAMPMPGMLTAEQMSRLLAARGAEFDRLFLRFMIQHHNGALTMVNDLLSSPGAGQETTIAAFIADVVADQRAEMDRMAAMLRDMPGEEQRP